MAGKSQLAENIAAMRRHFDGKQAMFAARLGTDQANVSKWEGGAEPKPLMLEKLANLAGCSIATLSSEPWEPPRQAFGQGKTPRPVTDHPATRTADQGEAVEIIQLDLSLPMGTGATIDDYVEEEPRIFDLAYIRGFTKTPPSRLRLARGVGDSMWPTLQSYDQVWIDSTDRVLNKTDRIWAVSINGAAAIKRLRPIKGGKVLVISDNPGPGHENYQVGADEVMIGGRVIRFARDL